jgi:uncharacterized protein
MIGSITEKFASSPSDIDARLYVMVFTEGSDDDAVRVISLRPAEKHEARYYHEQV